MHATALLGYTSAVLVTSHHRNAREISNVSFFILCLLNNCSEFKKKRLNSTLRWAKTAYSKNIVRFSGSKKLARYPSNESELHAQGAVFENFVHIVGVSI